MKSVDQTLKSKEAIMKKYDTNNQTLQREVCQLNKSKEVIYIELKKAMDQITLLTKDRERQTMLIKDFRAQIKTMEKEHNAMTEDIHKKETQLCIKEGKMFELGIKIGEINKEMIKQISIHKEEKEKADREFKSKLERQNFILRGKDTVLLEKDKILLSHKNLVANMTKEKKEATSQAFVQNASYIQRIEILKNELEKKDDDKAKLNNEIIEFEEQKKKLEIKFTDVMEDNGRLQIQMEELRDNITQAANVAMKQLVEVTSDQNSLKNLIENLKANNKTLEEEKIKMSKAIQAADLRHAGKTHEIKQSFQVSLDAKTKEISDLHATLKENKIKINCVKRKVRWLNSLRQKLRWES